jgi:hypothetical protein
VKVSDIVYDWNYDSDNPNPLYAETIEVEVGNWPTQSHILRAAEAIDIISIPRIGDVLRAVAKGIDGGGVDKKEPWDDAEMGDVWAFTTSNGARKAFVRSDGGWRPVARRKILANSADLRDGELVWKMQYAVDPDDCPLRPIHGNWPKCNRCGSTST